MYFEIINEIKNVETIAVGGNIRDIMRFRKKDTWGSLTSQVKIISTRSPILFSFNCHMRLKKPYN